MIGRIANLFRVADIRSRLWVTFLFLVVYRIGMNVPIPGADMHAFKKILSGTEQGGLDFVNFVNMLSGGSIGGVALFSLGIMPYISASIILSLLVKVIPSLENVQKEGQAGQRKINQWTRWLTVPLAIIQGIIIVRTTYRTEFPALDMHPLLQPGVWTAFSAVISLTVGTVFLMWVGEQITEHGIGNGVSLLIMCGIIARLPENVRKMVATHPSVVTPILLLVLFFAVVIVVVYITKGTRRIPVQFAKLMRGRRMMGGNKHFLPIKVNQAGVMPVIFGSSLLALPQLIAGAVNWEWLKNVTLPGSWFYTVGDVALIYFFSFFWTSLMFNPAEMSKNMKEQGTFIPGIRPGRHTADFLHRVMIHVTLAGATFLAIIAIVPGWLAREADAQGAVASFLGGTSILIVVSVALDLVDKLNSSLLMRRYEGFMGGEGEKD
jgi:preprotein translocase subunit SecY